MDITWRIGAKGTSPGERMGRVSAASAYREKSPIIIIILATCNDARTRGTGLAGFLPVVFVRAHPRRSAGNVRRILKGLAAAAVAGVARRGAARGQDGYIRGAQWRPLLPPFEATGDPLTDVFMFG